MSFKRKGKEMKLTSDSKTLAENKVLILYILNKINKCINNDSLLKLVLSIQDMNYFYFQQFVLDLLEAHYIVSHSIENETVYEITELGKETLSLTQDLVPGIIKLKIDNTVKAELNEIEEANSVTSEFIAYKENEFTVKCKIVENNATIFEVQSFAGSRDQAKLIADNWEKNSSKIYPEIMKLLTTTDESEKKH